MKFTIEEQNHWFELDISHNNYADFRNLFLARASFQLKDLINSKKYHERVFNAMLTDVLDPDFPYASLNIWAQMSEDENDKERYWHHDPGFKNIGGRSSIPIIETWADHDMDSESVQDLKDKLSKYGGHNVEALRMVLQETIRNWMDRLYLYREQSALTVHGHRAAPRLP